MLGKLTEWCAETTKDEPNGDILRIVYNEAIAVKGALGQSPNQMTSLAGSGIKTKGNHKQIWKVAALFVIMLTHYSMIDTQRYWKYKLRSIPEGWKHETITSLWGSILK